MSKKLLSLSVFTIALAAAFVFWAPSGTMAAGGDYQEGYMNSPNSFASDHGWNAEGAGTSLDRDYDRDRGRAMQPPQFQGYGLQGDWSRERPVRGSMSLAFTSLAPMPDGPTPGGISPTLSGVPPWAAFNSVASFA